MSRVVIIGGSGHVGTYLVPRLVSAGFEVVSVSRGQRQPYQSNGAWEFVRAVTLSREAEENAGTFGGKSVKCGPVSSSTRSSSPQQARDIWWRPCAGRCGISYMPERSGCTAPARKFPPPKCNRGVPLASMESQRRKSRRI